MQIDANKLHAQNMKIQVPMLLCTHSDGGTLQFRKDFEMRKWHRRTLSEPSFTEIDK